MRRRTALFTLCAFLLTPMFSLAQQPAGQWKAGVAKVNITPKEFMWMSGYASRKGPAEGKEHDLWAKALVLEDAAGKMTAVRAVKSQLKAPQRRRGELQRCSGEPRRRHNPLLR